MGIIEEYRVAKSRGTTDGLHWVMRVEGTRYEAVSDRTLGSVIAAQRELMRVIAQTQGVLLPNTPTQTGAIWPLQTITIEPTHLQAGYHVVLDIPPYTFEAYMDPTLESWITLWGGAMKFFAYKHGVITIWDEVSRNTQRAHEQGYFHAAN